MLKFEEIVATQSQEISELKQNRDPAHDRVIASHDVRLAEHGVRLDLIDNKYQRGVLLWKIVASNMAEESLSHAVEETRHNALGDCPNFQTDDVRIFYCYRVRFATLAFLVGVQQFKILLLLKKFS